MTIMHFFFEVYLNRNLYFLKIYPTYGGVLLLLGLFLLTSFGTEMLEVANNLHNVFDQFQKKVMQIFSDS